MNPTDALPTRRHLGWGVPAALVCAGLAVSCGETVPPPPSPDVWAVVDGREIYRDDVERAYRRAAPPDSTPSQDEAFSAKLGLLDELIDREILLGRAQALKVDVTDADVEKAFAERRSNMEEEAFRKELEARRITLDDMKSDLRRELTIQKLLEQEVGAKAAISDQTVREFYDQNRSQFNVPETRYRLAQIVVTPVREEEIRNRANSDATTPAEAKRKLQMLMERLENGSDFSTLAMDYSEDAQTAPQGGDLGFVPASALNQVAPELRQAVLKAKPGEVTSVSVGGAHTLLLLIAREEAGQRDLGSPGVREGITGLLRERREQLLSAAYVAAARNDAKVVNHLARQIVEGERAMPGLVPSAPGRQ